MLSNLEIIGCERSKLDEAVNKYKKSESRIKYRIYFTVVFQKSLEIF